ncbi:hypothetical protein BASA50_000196 [Batrachochytrium salamandrivorans]|uniref:Uncharacterized protein n=1 Tax=Batrachochytrium salamandrivorans TaxID=1357716 RepID=A0ABQ8EXD3_9FUNG|nr:hypothetical protein BASA50_000196 [Batrachochytrium salamandrivorans]
MRLSVITLPICLIGTISANPHPTGRSRFVSDPVSESCRNRLDCKSNGMYSNSGGKTKVPKGDSPNYKETTKGLFKLSSVSDVHEPKELQHPPTQEQSDEVIATPEAGSNRGASDSTSASAISGVAKKAKNYWKGKNKKPALKRTKSETMREVVRLLKKSDIYKPNESTKSSATWYTGSDAHEPKESQHPPTQEQSDEVIATPEAGSNRGTSDSTGASAISDMAKKADIYWKGKNKELALKQTESEAMGRVVKLLKASDVYEPKKSQHPPTQEQSDEVIAIPKARSNHGTSDSTGASAISDMAKKADIYWKGKNKELALKQTESETMGRVVKLLKASDVHEPKKSQHPPTQEQSGEIITTPKAGSNRGTSDSTSASAISDLARKAKNHWKGKNKKSALRQTKSETMNEVVELLKKSDIYKPKENTKSSST